jgi:reactive intermediate/imine deaminase
VPRETIGGRIPGLPFSKAVRVGDFVYVSGSVGFDANNKLVTGGIEPETRQVMENIKSVLAEAGCTLDDVVKCSVWLDDPRDFGIFNRVFAEYFGDDAPARSTVRSELMIDAKIEIDAIAYKPVG